MYGHIRLTELHFYSFYLYQFDLVESKEIMMASIHKIMGWNVESKMTPAGDSHNFPIFGKGKL
jgi:hypothetical protein